MLATLSEIKIQLGITGTDQDTLLNQLLRQSDKRIKTYTGRVLEASNLTEYYNGEGQNIFILKNYPVNTLTSFQKNIGTLGNPVFENFDNDNYKLIPETGEIFISGGLDRGVQNIKVVYNAGYTEIPKDLNLACIQLTGYLFNTKNSQGIASESVDGASIRYSNEAIGSTIPSEILEILNIYKKEIYV